MASSSMSTCEIEILGEDTQDSTELSEVQESDDTDGDNVDSSDLFRISSNLILHLWLGKGKYQPTHLWEGSDQKVKQKMIPRKCHLPIV